MVKLENYNIKPETSYTGDYSNFDKLISEYFHINFECIAEEEWSNDESHVFEVVAEEMDEYSQEQCDDKDYSYLTAALLCQMCFEGAIPAGDYTINICW